MGDKLYAAEEGGNDFDNGLSPDTQDALSVDHIYASAPGSMGLDPNSEEWKRKEKALVRKIDLRLMPILVLLYILNVSLTLQSQRLSYSWQPR